MLLLPSEIRSRIYQLLFTQQPVRDSLAGVLLVCRQVRSEALLDFYRRARFSFRHRQQVQRFALGAGPFTDQVRQVEVVPRDDTQLIRYSVVYHLLTTIYALARHLPSLEQIDVMPLPGAKGDQGQSGRPVPSERACRVRREVLYKLIFWTTDEDLRRRAAPILRKGNHGREILWGRVPLRRLPDDPGRTTIILAFEVDLSSTESRKASKMARSI